MKIFIIVLLTIALQCAQAAQPTAFTQSRCLTAYSSKSGIVSTTTTAYTLTFRPPVVYTLTPSIIVTPAATTTTTTTTLFSTSTLPAPTSTTTFTETDSTTASVSTVPIPDGFQYPSPTPGAPQKRAISQLIARGGALINGRTTPTTKSPHCSGSPQKYPSKVTCYELVESFIPTTITQTAKKTTTKFAPTPTVTTTASTTSTITVAASTTITTSTTTTTTMTATETDTITTSTITQTATYTPPATSTYYAACATSANQVSSDYQGRILRLLDTGNAVNQDFATNSAYDCCVACFQTPNCFGANYGAGFGAISCELEVGTTCPASQGGFGGDYSNGGDPSLALTFSNGPCGNYVYSAS